MQYQRLCFPWTQCKARFCVANGLYGVGANCSGEGSGFIGRYCCRHNHGRTALAAVHIRSTVWLNEVPHEKRLTFDMRGGLTAQPARHPLDGRVRQRPARLTLTSTLLVRHEIAFHLLRLPAKSRQRATACKAPRTMARCDPDRTATRAAPTWPPHRTAAAPHLVDPLSRRAGRQRTDSS